MVVYNITIKIDATIEQEWIKWQKDEHIPDVMSSGLFDEYKFFRLLEQDETADVTYVVQYFASSLENYKNYIENFAPLLREKAFGKWGKQFIAFRTIMEAVN